MPHEDARRPPKGPDRRSPHRAGARPHSDRGGVVLYGWHSVAEALANPDRRHRKLLVTENALAKLNEGGRPLPLSPDVVRTSAISRLLEPDAVHQGLYLECEPLPDRDLDELGPDDLVVALDQITDPHNVGAIVRTCAAFGVSALVTTARHSPSATGVLAKAASGGLEHVPFAVVPNLGNALTQLSELGLRCVGLDSDGAGTLDELGPPGRGRVLVLGAEGRGLRQRTRACCDAVVRLDMPGAIRSLNVSNAAAIALYASTRRRDG